MVNKRTLNILLIQLLVIAMWAPTTRNKTALMDDSTFQSDS